MSADLNYNKNTGNASIFTLGDSWHMKGEIVKEAQTSEQAIKLAGLDYEVEKKAMKVGEDIVPNYFATVRTDTNEILGVVGNRYSVLQNKQAFSFIDDIVGSKDAIFHSAGALGSGERIFLTCKLPEKLVVGLNDVADNYFFISNSHDGSKAVELAFTNVFIVCDNTLREALRTAKRKQSVRHTKSVYTGMTSAADIMGITRQNIITQKETFNAMSKVSVTDEQLRKFIEMAMKPEREQIGDEEFSTRFQNTVDEVLTYGLSDPAQMIVERKGNLWGAYNAVTGWINNVETYKTPEHKLKAIMYGQGLVKSQKALDLALNVLGNNSILS